MTTAQQHALTHFDDIVRRLGPATPAVFLDYDGTIAPIVQRPELAVLSPAMRETITALAHRCPVAIVSGRDRRNVEHLIGLDAVYCVGSHGFDIAGPGGVRFEHDEGTKALPALDAATADLEQAIAGVPGAFVERKRFAVSVHYRLVAESDVARVDAAFAAVTARYPTLATTGGKKIHELRPRFAWNKGSAVVWLLARLGLDRRDILPCYLGDDLTDEDAFAALADRGVSIVVGPEARTSHAQYLLDDVSQVRIFLERLVGILDGRAGAAGR